MPRTWSHRWHHLANCLEWLYFHSYWKWFTFLEGFSDVGWKEELSVNSLKMWMTRNIHLAPAFRSLFTAPMPPFPGFPLTLQSTFVSPLKSASPLLPFGPRSQPMCSRTLCFCFAKSEIWTNSDILFFPICYSITFRISDICTSRQCQQREGEPVRISGSICTLSVARPESRASLILCGTEAQRDHILNWICYLELHFRYINTHKTHTHTSISKDSCGCTN